jgi:hypothetical protein
VIFTSIVGVLTAILKYTNLLPAIHQFWYMMLLFFFGFTLLTFSILLNQTKRPARKFFLFFLGISMLRMLLFTGVTLMYVFLINRNDMSDSVRFILTFAVNYFIFTTWEAFALMSALKKQKNVAP